MKKAWVVLAMMVTAAVTSFVTVGVHNAYLRAQQFRNEEAARAFVDETIQAYCSSWDQQQLIDRSNYELVKMLDPKTNTKFRNLLGPLKKSYGAVGTIWLGFMGGDAMTKGEFHAAVVFEKGTGTIQMSVIKLKGQWQVLSLFINSDALMR